MEISNTASQLFISNDSSDIKCATFKLLCKHIFLASDQLEIIEGVKESIE